MSSEPPCTVIPKESFRREEIEGKTSKLLNILYNDELVSCHKKAVVIKLEEYRLQCLDIFTKDSCLTTNFTKAKEDSLDVLCDPNATYSKKTQELKKDKQSFYLIHKNLHTMLCIKQEYLIIAIYLSICLK